MEKDGDKRNDINRDPQKEYPIDVPCNKMMYKSEAEARAAILQLPMKLHYYTCIKCGFIHLTRYSD